MRVFRVIVVASLLIVCLSGCGSATDTATPDPTATESAPDPTDEPTEEDPAKKALMKSAKALEKKLDEIENLFTSTSDKQDIPRTRNVSRKIGSAMRSVSSSWESPTDDQKWLLARAEQALEKALDTLNGFMDEEVAPFRKKVQEAGVTLLPAGEPIKLKD